MKQQLIITYDNNTADNGGALDLYAYLQNELDNRRIVCRMQEISGATGALLLLRLARDLLRKVGAVKTLARVRYAIKSAEGADRHAAPKARGQQ